MGCEFLVTGIVAGLTLTAAALVFQFFSESRKEFHNLSKEMEISKYK